MDNDKKWTENEWKTNKTLYKAWKTNAQHQLKNSLAPWKQKYREDFYAVFYKSTKIWFERWVNHGSVLIACRMSCFCAPLVFFKIKINPLQPDSCEGHSIRMISRPTNEQLVSGKSQQKFTIVMQKWSVRTASSWFAVNFIFIGGRLDPRWHTCSLLF